MPAFNEEASVGDVVREVRTKLPGIRVLVVDDGSTDATTSVAKAAGAKVATLPFNLGVGGAMRTGFRYALENGYENVVQIDSDGQHDPSSVPALLEQLATADLVLGARFAGEGDYKVSGPRRWAMIALATTLSRTAKSKLTDTTSGYRASGPKAVAIFARLYGLWPVSLYGLPTFLMGLSFVMLQRGITTVESSPVIILMNWHLRASAASRAR